MLPVVSPSGIQGTRWVTRPTFGLNPRRLQKGTAVSLPQRPSTHVSGTPAVCQAFKPVLDSSNGEAAQRDGSYAAPVLHFQEFLSEPAQGQSSAPVTAVILPGITCNSQDYFLLASQLASRAAQLTGGAWRVVAVDLRHHGRSVSTRPPWPGPSDMAAAAADVAALFQRQLGASRPDVIIGHSLGGKVALSLLCQLRRAPWGTTGAQRPMQVWVVDGRVRPIIDTSGPFYTAGPGFIRSLQHVPLPLASKEDVIALATQHGFSTEYGQYFTSRLVPVEAGPQAGYVWNFDTHGVAEMMESYLHADCGDAVKNAPPGVSIHIVRAMESDVFDGGEDELSMICHVESVTAQHEMLAQHGAPSGGRLFLHEVPGATHFLPIQQPALLLELMLPALAADYTA